jgi:cytochrome c-type biogenesis protein
MPSPQELVVAFAAGAVTFASPCMLPLVPGFAAWTASASAATTAPVAPAPTDDPQRRPRRAPGSLELSAWFVLGFGLIFVALGTLSGAAGSALQQVRGPAQVVGGLVIAGLGAFMLLDRWLPVRLQQRVGMQERRFAPTAPGAIGFGAVFGAAWSPCIGPTLGAILTLAAGSGGAADGAILLAVFAVGLGVPFMLLAGGIGSASRVLPVLRRNAGVLRIASGATLLLFGLLLASGLIARLSAQLSGITGFEL